jgi:hypothetical protein
MSLSKKMDSGKMDEQQWTAANMDEHHGPEYTMLGLVRRIRHNQLEWNNYRAAVA